MACRLGRAKGRLHLSKDCYRHIYLEGRFVALARTRIEVINRHGAKQFSPRLQIGDDVPLGHDCNLSCINEARIGARVSATAQRPDRLVTSKGPVIIEDEVWLGESVIIMPRVHTGRSSVIGANSVITQDSPPFSVAVGAPAQIIRIVKPLAVTTLLSYLILREYKIYMINPRLDL